MKQCTKCGLEEGVVEFYSTRARICNDCRAPKPVEEPAKQQLTDAELQALWEQSNEVTVIPHSEATYEPAEHTISTVPEIEFDYYGRRIYTNLDQNHYTAISLDTNTCDYGGGTNSAGSD